jgi:hypothetical protein
MNLILLDLIKFRKVNIKLQTKLPKKPQFVKDAEDGIEKKINDKIVSPLKKNTDDISYTVKTVAGVIVNMELSQIISWMGVAAKPISLIPESCMKNKVDIAHIARY